MKSEAASQSRQIDSLLGDGVYISQLKRKIQLYAKLGDDSVLIVGETGTGKELIARAIHEESGRGGGLHAVNCNAYAGDASLVNSELFGYKKGAFTGAVQDTPGVLRAAGKGTVFLDEIGDLPPMVQGKLLRAIENRVIRPVGDHTDKKIECRFIAATNKVSSPAYGLRSDLLNRFDHQVLAEPLMHHREDVIVLFLSFADEFCQRYRLNKLAEVPLSVAYQLLTHSWPGNVRELRRITREWVLHHMTPEISRKLLLPLFLDFSYFESGKHFDSNWADRGLRLDPFSWSLSAVVSRDLLNEWSARASETTMTMFRAVDSYFADRLLEQIRAAEGRLLSGNDTFPFRDPESLANEGRKYWGEVRRLEGAQSISKSRFKPTASPAATEATPRSPEPVTDIQSPVLLHGESGQAKAFVCGPKESVVALVTGYCKTTVSTHKNQTEAAISLGISRATLRKYLRGAKSHRLR